MTTSERQRLNHLQDHPSEASRQELAQLADALLDTRKRGRKVSREYPWLTRQQWARRRRSEPLLKRDLAYYADFLAVHPVAQTRRTRAGRRRQVSRG